MSDGEHDGAEMKSGGDPEAPAAEAEAKGEETGEAGVIEKVEAIENDADETAPVPEGGTAPHEEAAEPEKAGEASEGWDYAERRTEERKKISLKKPFLAEIHLDQVRKTYIYIVDVSHGGMKIVTDLTIPEDQTFTLKLNMKEPATFVVKSIWQRQILGYMNAVGIKFMELSPEARAIVDSIVNKFAIDISRSICSPRKMMDFQIQQDGQWQTFYAYVINLSLEGLEYTTDFILPINEEFHLKAFFIQAEAPLEMAGRIASEKDLSMGRTKGWLEFVNLDDKSRLRLKEFIISQIQGEPPKQVISTIEDFEIPE